MNAFHAREYICRSRDSRTNPPSMTSVTARKIMRIASVGASKGRDAWMQIEVDWDSGRGLMLTVPPDRFELMRGEE